MAYQVVERCDLKTGERVGNRYVIEKVLGEGSFGKVYRALDSTGTVYALKLLHLWDITPDLRQPLMDRFEMEFKTGQINSPYLVQSLDYGKVGGNPYIVMEFCPGGDLTSCGGLPESKVAEICQQILLGLHALHIQGKVHRDLKPENVLFKKNGIAALTDFGISGDRNHRMTERNWLGKPNQIFGTYAYMPPEQVNPQRGKATVLPTTDIFSFGVLAFQLLTGKLPFGELTNHNELANYQKRGKNGDWNRHSLSKLGNGNQWMQLLEGCLQPNFKKRFQSVKEVLQYLPITKQEKIVQIEPKQPLEKKGTCLRIMQGEEFGKVYNLTNWVSDGMRIITIGRDGNNLIALKEEISSYISRNHCCIEYNPTGNWTIRDGQWNKHSRIWTNSTNGTYVNSTQVSQLGYLLTGGDIITIGDIKIKFENN